MEVFLVVPVWHLVILDIDSDLRLGNKKLDSVPVKHLDILQELLALSFSTMRNTDVSASGAEHPIYLLEHALAIALGSISTYHGIKESFIYNNIECSIFKL